MLKVHEWICSQQAGLSQQEKLTQDAISIPTPYKAKKLDFPRLAKIKADKMKDDNFYLELEAELVEGKNKVAKRQLK